MRVAVIFKRRMHSASHHPAEACVGDLQVRDFPILLIFQQNGVFK